MTRLERILVWGSTATVAATGLTYGAMKHLMHPVDEWAVVNHPLQPLVLKVHIVAAPVLVFALGMLAARHILPLLRVRRPGRRRTGLLSAAVVGPLVLSGYLLQAITDSGVMRVLGFLHLALGAIFAVAAAAHAIAATTQRDRREAATDRPLKLMKPAATPRTTTGPPVRDASIHGHRPPRTSVLLRGK